MCFVIQMGFISLSLGPAHTVLESVTFKCTLQLSFPSGTVCKQPYTHLCHASYITAGGARMGKTACHLWGFFSRRSLLPPYLSPLTFLSVTSHFSILSSLWLRAFSTNNEGSDAGVWFGAGRTDVWRRWWWWWGVTGTRLVWLFMQPASTASWFNSFCQLFCILLIMAATLRQTEGCGGERTLFLTVHQQPLLITSKGLALVFGQCLCSSSPPVILLG